MPDSLPRADNARERVLNFQGGCNFRDIGGYRTRDGGSVRWGRVYRSGVLSCFSSEDDGLLTQLGVRSICDLRRDDERQREPTRWPSAVNMLSWDDDADIPTVRRFYAPQTPNAAGMRQAMIDLYRALPLWMGSRMRGMIDCLAVGATPLVIHCAAGKDRTGFAIALLLRILDVEHDVIMDDYLLTNRTTDYEEFVRGHHTAKLGLTDDSHPLLSLPRDVRNVLFAADADYLSAALTHIDTQLGGMNDYLRCVVGVTDGTLRQVREQLINR